MEACKEALTTKANLMNRKITSENACNQCKNDVESAIHAFLWSCNYIRPIWEEKFKWAIQEIRAMSQFIDVVGFILRENRNKDLFAMSAWSIWYRQNAMRQNQQVVQWTWSTVTEEKFEEYQRHNSTNKPSIRAARILQNKLPTELYWRY